MMSEAVKTILSTVDINICHCVGETATCCCNKLHGMYDVVLLYHVSRAFGT
jgi:hypothetical protein